MTRKSRFRDRVVLFRDQNLSRIAEQLLAEKGCGNFSTKELAEIAGVGKGTVYVHRPSQAAWLSGVLQEVAERQSAALPKCETQSNPVEILRRQIAFLIQSVAQAPTGTLAVPCCLHSSPCPQKAWTVLAQTIRHCLEEAIAAALIRPELSVNVILDTLQSLLVAVNHEPIEKRAEALRGVERVLLNQLFGLEG